MCGSVVTPRQKGRSWKSKSAQSDSATTAARHNGHTQTAAGATAKHAAADSGTVTKPAPHVVIEN